MEEFFSDLTAFLVVEKIVAQTWWRSFGFEILECKNLQSKY
jgi:hypothetical protein